MNHHHSVETRRGTRVRTRFAAVTIASRNRRSTFEANKLVKLLVALALVIGIVAPLTPMTADAAINNGTVGAAAHTNGTSISVSRSTTVADKDILIAQLVVREITTANTVCAPIGWHPIRRGCG